MAASVDSFMYSDLNTFKGDFIRAQKNIINNSIEQKFTRVLSKDKRIDPTLLLKELQEANAHYEQYKDAPALLQVTSFAMNQGLIQLSLKPGECKGNPCITDDTECEPVVGKISLITLESAQLATRLNNEYFIRYLIYNVCLDEDIINQIVMTCAAQGNLKILKFICNLTKSNFDPSVWALYEEQFRGDYKQSLQRKEGRYLQEGVLFPARDSDSLSIKNIIPTLNILNRAAAITDDIKIVEFLIEKGVDSKHLERFFKEPENPAQSEVIKEMVDKKQGIKAFGIKRVDSKHLEWFFKEPKNPARSKIMKKMVDKKQEAKALKKSRCSVACTAIAVAVAFTSYLVAVAINKYSE